MKSFKVSSCMFGRASIEASEFRALGLQYYHPYIVEL